MATNEEFIAQLLPQSQQQFRNFLTKATQNGFDLRITSGYRSMEEQAQLYANGRGGYTYNGKRYKDLTGKIVTNAKPGQSNHNLRKAIDIVDRAKGYNLDWPKLGNIGKSVGLAWGGDWASFPDKPHFEFVKVDTPPPPDNTDDMWCQFPLYQQKGQSGVYYLDPGNYLVGIPAFKVLTDNWGPNYKVNMVDNIDTVATRIELIIRDNETRKQQITDLEAALTSCQQGSGNDKLNKAKDAYKIIKGVLES